MVENLSSGQFTPLINREITLTTESGERIPLVVIEVLENAKGKPRRAPASQRVPFSVLLSGPARTGFTEGACTLVLPDSDVRVSLHVNRIAPADGRNDKAWYEITFC
jgi:hypothetical protein